MAVQKSRGINKTGSLRSIVSTELVTCDPVRCKQSKTSQNYWASG